ncbi:MAG: hypothetical protein ABSC60_10715 [Acidobacteriota bacterium]
MNRAKMVAALCSIPLMLLLVGCKPIAALNPLFSESERIFEPQLLGEWVSIDPQKKESLKFDSSNVQEKLYKIEIGGLEESGQLGKIGDDYFLDLSSTEQKDLPNKGQGELSIIRTANGYEIRPAIVMVSEELYLDFRTNHSDSAAPDQPQKVSFQIRPMHTFFRLKIENNQLTIRSLDDEKFIKQVDAGKISLAHQKAPFPLITADRPALKEFFSIYGKSEELFDEPDIYRRVASSGKKLI